MDVLLLSSVIHQSIARNPVQLFFPPLLAGKLSHFDYET